MNSPPYDPPEQNDNVDQLDKDDGLNVDVDIDLYLNPAIDLGDAIVDGTAEKIAKDAAEETRKETEASPMLS